MTSITANVTTWGHQHSPDDTVHLAAGSPAKMQPQPECQDDNIILEDGNSEHQETNAVPKAYVDNISP